MRRDRTAAYLVLAGVLTGAAGAVTSQATVWALRATDSPVVAVASAVRDLTPGPLALRLIDVVGHLDKPLLITGTLTFLLLLCGAVGLLSRRHPLLPDVVFFALAIIGLWAVVRLQDSGIASGLAVVVGLVTWIVTLRFLTAPFLGTQVVSSGAGAGVVSPESRRTFLLRAGGTTAAVLVAGAAGRIASSGRRRVEQARKLLRLPVHHGVVPDGANVGVPGITPWRTSNDAFYLIHTALAPPTVSPNDWRLRIHGMVDRERTYTYDDLVRRQLTEAWVTLCCVSNEVGGDLIGNAYWSG
ncbi:MAG TPA: molybdopterin-dependent oxidoreductase, partial [Marmoricola sp.]|nr:molybdopterin-dependent oxidoreductase [Marmoricola sp.]